MGRGRLPWALRVVGAGAGVGLLVVCLLPVCCGSGGGLGTRWKLLFLSPWLSGFLFKDPASALACFRETSSGFCPRRSSWYWRNS